MKVLVKEVKLFNCHYCEDTGVITHVSYVCTDCDAWTDYEARKWAKIRQGYEGKDRDQAGKM